MVGRASLRWLWRRPRGGIAEGRWGSPVSVTAYAISAVRAFMERVNALFERVMEANRSPRTAPVDFETFFHEEYPRLFRALVVVTRSQQDADELAQEAFARLWEHWERVATLEDPTGYLYRTAMNAYFLVNRRAARAIVRAVTPTQGRDPLELVEIRDTLQRAILLLPARQRAALVVTELLGYDSDSAATILGVRPGTVRRLASQARRALRGELGNENAEPEGRDSL